jgi:uncharacterized protein with von Willebrand factor type A (vWA) domain
MAPSYIAGIVVVLVQLLRAFGIEVGSTELTTTIETLLTLGAGLVVMYRQLTTGRATIAGTRPQ